LADWVHAIAELIGLSLLAYAGVFKRGQTDAQHAMRLDAIEASLSSMESDMKEIETARTKLYEQIASHDKQLQQLVELTKEIRDETRETTKEMREETRQMHRENREDIKKLLARK
jgi:septal ring factor EnvC (AmiA/AmiB activator)